MVNRFETYCQTTPISKTLGQFENLVFVIMSTRENVRLIARCSFDTISVEGLASMFLLIPQLFFFTIKECKLDSSNNGLFDLSGQYACARFKHVKCS